MSLVALREAAIARTRVAIESLMTSTGTILRNAPTRTPTGGSQENYVSIGTTKCLLTASILGGGTEDLEAGQVTATMSYTLGVPSGTDIGPSDRIRVNDTTFEVKAIKRADSWSTSDSAILVEIQR